ncbi:MAG: HNH endonuclease [Actinomycetota bacterium]|nr:HNH endonuclease [Actinomycetota bacterium]
MSPKDAYSDEDLIDAVDGSHREASRVQRELLGFVAEVDRRELWRGSGARDMAHWLSMRQGISQWKARRWIAAGHALEHLTDLARALSSGELGIDKVVELARFATFESEAGLISWARFVSTAAVRRRADLEMRRTIEDVRDAEHARFLNWWMLDDGNRFGLEAELPAAQGAIVARALQRVSDSIPLMPGEEDSAFAPARRADALVALCSNRIAVDADPDRATVVVHARLGDLVGTDGAAEVEGGGRIHPETARRLLCDARVQTVLEDGDGEPVRLGRLSRDPTPAMMRQLRYRDVECRFPACGARRFTQAHHIVWWKEGGTTDLDNLVLVCFFHHKLVHEHGWSLHRQQDGSVDWLKPDGSSYVPLVTPPKRLRPGSALVPVGPPAPP